MEKIAIITDTTSDLDDEFVSKNNISVLPFTISYSYGDFKDKFEITPMEVYKNLDKEIPKSSLPSIQDLENAIEKLKSEGYNRILIITISSGLSGFYNAANMVAESHTDIKIHAFDSKSLSAGEGYIVERCVELINKGTSFEEIISKLSDIRSGVKLFFIVGTLEYLIKGGRIGRVSGTIGEFLNIKPIISVGKEDGQYYQYAKVRGRKQSLNKIIEIGKEITKDCKKKIYILSGNAEEESISLCKEFEKLPNVISAEYRGNISATASMHSGPGLVGILFVD
ncbi:DegV family protein [Clostridium sp. 19966]|uniref:DegV family protein n=1 Tax=Clostridium sp. 19966 TaxID=2768166 RepID=UPI0028DD878F|nr:DegV family protein [Clostridium sp. 19966]MDT8716379.1 DegV family protein [Clostridium sp. 19966]